MEKFFEILFIIAGAICLCIGLAQHIVALIVIGIILLAIGGVWVIFFDDNSCCGCDCDGDCCDGDCDPCS